MLFNILHTHLSVTSLLHSLNSQLRHDWFFYFHALLFILIVFLNSQIFATLDSERTAFFSPSVNIFQIYFYCYLHFWVGDKDICERILCCAVHLPERSLELAGLHRHCHGVSNKIIYVSCILTINLTYTLHHTTAREKSNLQVPP